MTIKEQIKQEKEKEVQSNYETMNNKIIASKQESTNKSMKRGIISIVLVLLCIYIAYAAFIFFPNYIETKRLYEENKRQVEEQIEANRKAYEETKRQIEEQTEENREAYEENKRQIEAQREAFEQEYNEAVQRAEEFRNANGF